MRHVCRWLVIASVCALSVVPLALQAQDVGNGTTLAHRSVIPLWELRPVQKERENLRKLEAKIRRALFLVGSEKTGWGTAFCVDAEQRLLVTARHVIDALSPGGVEVYGADGVRCDVRRMWKHPRAFRVLLDGRTAPADRTRGGRLSHRGFDVAVFQLSSDGPPPAGALTLGRPERAQTIVGHAVGVLDAADRRTPWMSLGLTYGTVATMEPLATIDAPADPAPHWFITHTAPGWPGASGAPLFLEDGTVVGVQNALTVCVDDERKPHLAFHAIHCAAVWDLLGWVGEDGPRLDSVHHGRDLPKELICRSLHLPAPPAGKHRSAYDIAWKLVLQNRHAEAADAFSQLTQDEPLWAQPFYGRSRTWLAYVKYRETYGGKLPPEKRTEYAQWALDDARDAVRRASSDLTLHLTLGAGFVGITQMTGDKRPAYHTCGFADAIFRSPGVPQEVQAQFLGLRGYAQFAVGNRNEAFADVTRAIALAPREPTFYGLRSALYALRGEQAKSRSDFSLYEKLRSESSDPDR